MFLSADPGKILIIITDALFMDVKVFIAFSLIFLVV